MPQKGKKNISNVFLDGILFFISFILAVPRSIMVFFGKKKVIQKNNIFYSFLDFLLSSWPKYFWKKPTGLKATSFFSDLWKYLFKI